MQEFLINSPVLDSPILDLPDDNELFSEAFFQSSDITSFSDIIEPNCTYEEGSLASNFSPCCPSMDALMEHQPLNTYVEEFIDCLQEPTPQFLSTKEQQELEQVMVVATATDAILGNGDPQYNEYTTNSMAHLSEVPTAPPPHPQQSLMQPIYNGNEQFLQPMSSTAITGYSNMDIRNGDQQYNEYTINSMAHLSEVPTAPPPHPQQSLIQPIYNGNERFLQPMSSTSITRYSNMDASISGLYQGGIGISACSGGQGQGCYPGGIVPMMMPMSMQMPMPLPEMEYWNTAMRPYNAQDSFQQHGYDSTNMQVIYLSLIIILAIKIASVGPVGSCRLS